MKIYKIGRMEHFLKLVDESKGNVMLELEGNPRLDLKQDRPARELLHTMRVGPEGLSIRCSDPNDAAVFLRDMVGMSMVR